MLLTLRTRSNLKDELIARQLEGEATVLKQLLDCVIIAVAHEKLQDISNAYFEDVCRHFAILLCSPSSATKSPQDCDIFVDALIDAIRAENRTYSKPALKGIDLLISTCTSLTTSQVSSTDRGGNVYVG